MTEFEWAGAKTAKAAAKEAEDTPSCMIYDDGGRDSKY
jgi:hypothetical protein